MADAGRRRCRGRSSTGLGQARTHAPPPPAPLPLPLPPTSAAGNVTPLNNADKEALKQRLEALDARRAGAPALGGSSTSCTASGKAAGQALSVPQHGIPGLSMHHSWLPALHTAQLNKQRAKAEHKRLAEAAARAGARATLVRCLAGPGGSRGWGRQAAPAAAAAGVSRLLAHAWPPAGRVFPSRATAAQHVFPPAPTSANQSPQPMQLRKYLARTYDPSGPAPADAALAASASMPLHELRASVAALAASRDLSPAEAELAAANLALLQPDHSADGSGDAEGGSGGGGGGARRRRHVWYGDPLLSTSEARHRVEVRAGEEACRRGWLCSLDCKRVQPRVTAVQQAPFLCVPPRGNSAVDACVLAAQERQDRSLQARMQPDLLVPVLPPPPPSGLLRDGGSAGGAAAPGL